MALDPVCGMTVDPARAAGHADHEGTTYYFCSKGCVAKFTADPKKYLSGAREPTHPPSRPTAPSAGQAPAPQGPLLTIGGLKTPEPRVPESRVPESRITSPQSQIPAEWVCPMDPEVVSDKPGACPKCGMALEPRVPDPSDAPNPELADMTRRFWIGVALGAPVFLLTMGDMVSGGALGHRIGLVWINWVSLLLATPVVLMPRQSLRQS